MFEGVKSSWSELRQGAPGKRFAEFYRHRQAGRTSATSRVLWLGIGGALCLVGVILLVIPGPGIPVLILGAGLVAQESRRVARMLDAAEVWIRDAIRWTRRRWSGSPSWAKVLVTVAAVLVVGALSAGAYQLTLGR